jgi:hypothetical protein
MTKRPRTAADGATQRYLQIQAGIPDRLDRMADEFADCLDLLARAGLSEALQPDPARHQAVPRQLRDAATRIRWAAALMPARTTRTHTLARGRFRDISADHNATDHARHPGS